MVRMAHAAATQRTVSLARNFLILLSIGMPPASKNGGVLSKLLYQRFEKMQYAGCDPAMQKKETRKSGSLFLVTVDNNDTVSQGFERFRLKMKT